MNKIISLILLLGVTFYAQNQKQEKTEDQKELVIQQCRDQIKWGSNPENAFKKAKAEKRLVLWYFSIVPYFEIGAPERTDDYMHMGPFMDKSLIEVIVRKFIPLRAVLKGELAEKAGVVKVKCMPPGFAIFDPNKNFIHRMDHFSTFNADHIRFALREILLKNPDFNKPSKTVQKKTKDAKSTKDKISLAEEMIFDGDYDDAKKMIGDLIGQQCTPSEKDALKFAGARLNRALRKGADAVKLLDEIKDHALKDMVSLEKGIVLMHLGDWSNAMSCLKELESAESLFYKGCAEYRLGNFAASKDNFNKALKIKDKSAVHWKAKSCMHVLTGGFLVTDIESFPWPPERTFKSIPVDSISRGEEKDLNDIIKAAVEYLLFYQLENGSWDYGWYDKDGLIFEIQEDFPEQIEEDDEEGFLDKAKQDCGFWGFKQEEKPIKPAEKKPQELYKRNGYVVSVGSISALALHYYENVYPEKTEKALNRFDSFLFGFKPASFSNNFDSWALAYQLVYLCERSKNIKGGARTKYTDHIESCVKALKACQTLNGNWRNDYEASWKTAEILRLCVLANESGANFPEDSIKKAADAVEKFRVKDGMFCYNDTASNKDHWDEEENEDAAGRSILCELSLALSKKSTKEKVQDSIKTFFKYRKFMEYARIFDMAHMDDHGAVGAHYFWMNNLAASHAIKMYSGDKSKEWREKMLKESVLNTVEINGSFVGEPELSRTYPTACALLIIKNCTDKK